MSKRTTLILTATLFLLSTTACSTSETAEKDDSPQTTQKTLTSEDGEKAERRATESAKKAEKMRADKGEKSSHKKKMAGMCPMQVDDTSRELVKLDDAVAMDFTTTGDVDEVRSRVQKMAAKHNKMHVDGSEMKKGKSDEMKKHAKGKSKGKMKGHDKGEMAEKHMEKMKMMDGVAAEASDIDGGARLTLTPDDPENADELFKMMKEHGGEKGQCPMMGHRGEKSSH